MSRSFIQLKRINIKFVSPSIALATSFQFFGTKRCSNIPMGTPLTVASNAGGVGKNRDSRPISGFIAYCHCQRSLAQAVDTTKHRPNTGLAEASSCYWALDLPQWRNSIQMKTYFNAGYILNSINIYKIVTAHHFINFIANVSDPVVDVGPSNGQAPGQAKSSLRYSSAQNDYDSTNEPMWTYTAVTLRTTLNCRFLTVMVEAASA